MSSSASPITPLKSKVKLEANATSSDYRKINYITLENVKFKSESVPKLQTDIKNFLEWKYHMESMWTSSGVIGVLRKAPSELEKDYIQEIEYSLPKLSKNEIMVKAQRLVHNHNIQTYTALLTAVTKTNAQQIVQDLISQQRAKPDQFIENNGYYLWRMIMEKYEDKTQLGKISLIHRLNKGIYKKGESPDTIKSYINNIENQLMQGGGLPVAPPGTLHDIFKVSALLSAIPDSMETVKTMIAAKEGITFDEAIIILESVYDQDKELNSLRSTRINNQRPLSNDEHAAHALVEAKIKNDCIKHPLVRYENTKHSWENCRLNPKNKNKNKGSPGGPKWKSQEGKQSTTDSEPEFNA